MNILLLLKVMSHLEVMRSDFIEITDIYEDKYYISCDQRDELVERVLGCVSLKPENNE